MRPERLTVAISLARLAATGACSALSSDVQRRGNEAASAGDLVRDGAAPGTVELRCHSPTGHRGSWYAARIIALQIASTARPSIGGVTAPSTGAKSSS
jgi:hypothetical protein